MSISTNDRTRTRFIGDSEEVTIIPLEKLRVLSEKNGKPTLEIPSVEVPTEVAESESFQNFREEAKESGRELKKVLEEEVAE